MSLSFGLCICVPLCLRLELLENASLLVSQGAGRMGQRGPGPVRRSCGAKADGQQIRSPVGEDTGENV